VLLFRQVAAAFWMTLFVPAALALIPVYFTRKDDASTEGRLFGWLIAILVAYSIAGVFWARRLFASAQDVQWTGGVIAMPGMRGLRALMAGSRERRRRPRAALVAKEFQLQQSQFVIAGVLALLHLGVIAARTIGDGFRDSPALEFFTGQFWVFWMVMPLLIGCTAVAEERKLGTLEAQLCLPARRWTQFVIKFSVALGLAVLFGVAAPVALEGGKILPDFHANLRNEMLNYYSHMPHGTSVVAALKLVLAINPLLPFLPQLLIAIGLVAISFYASTIARHTLQAISSAIPGIVLASVLLGNSQPIGDALHLWRGSLIYFIGVPTLTVTIAWLASWNFKRVLVGWPVWRRNILVVMASLATVLVSIGAIYNRAWEQLSPNEPSHGTARLKAPQNVTLRSEFFNLTVQLPDGRVWTDRLMPTVPSLGAMVSGDWKTIDIFPGGRFLDGTNWSSVAFGYLDVAAIRRDGSLWVSEQSENPSMFWRPRSDSNQEPIKLVQLGDDKDWKAVAGSRPPVFLLKTDGTLWRWGPARVVMRTNWPGLRAFQPERLGTASDWSELGCDNNQIWFRKADGRTWISGGFQSVLSEPESLRFGEETTLLRAPYRDGRELRGYVRHYRPRGNQFEVRLRDDGTLRIREWRWKQTSKQEFTSGDVQLGQESDWLALVGNNGDGVVTLKVDGSLWDWEFPDDSIAKANTARATRLGAHADWVAITSDYLGTYSLAADGSLWLWRNGSRDFRPSEFAILPLLAPSRKPLLIGNIFTHSPP
jgi:ABC-type transport system involved in multi-copper enzyme maturation permease subunit